MQPLGRVLWHLTTFCIVAYAYLLTAVLIRLRLHIDMTPSQPAIPTASRMRYLCLTDCRMLTAQWRRESSSPFPVPAEGFMGTGWSVVVGS